MSRERRKYDSKCNEEQKDSSSIITEHGMSTLEKESKANANDISTTMRNWMKPEGILWWACNR